MNELVELLRNPWPWYVAGPLLGLTVPILLLLGNKRLGVSSTLRQICAATVPARIEFLRYDWKKDSWNLYFVVGIVLGAFIGGNILGHPDQIKVSSETLEALRTVGITDLSGFLPAQIFGWDSLSTLRGFLLMVVGGFLVGFGTRYAGGCTSGHGLTGTATLQWPSLIALLTFFAGGIVSTHLILPIIFNIG